MKICLEECIDILLISKQCVMRMKFHYIAHLRVPCSGADGVAKQEPTRTDEYKPYKKLDVGSVA